MMFFHCAKSDWCRMLRKTSFAQSNVKGHADDQNAVLFFELSSTEHSWADSKFWFLSIRRAALRAFETVMPSPLYRRQIAEGLLKFTAKVLCASFCYNFIKLYRQQSNLCALSSHLMICVRSNSFDQLLLPRNVIHVTVSSFVPKWWKVTFNVFYVLLIITMNILCPACYNDKYFLSRAWCLYLVFQHLLLVPHPYSCISILSY